MEAVPRATGPRGATAALLELDVELHCRWLDLDSEIRPLGQKFGLRR